MPIAEGEPESWFNQEGARVDINRSTEHSVIAETSSGEIEICETCYQIGLPDYFTPKDLAGIHYQFGLEYRVTGQHTRSIDSLMKAKRLEESADILAALALTESELGHNEVARRLYMRALEVDPKHFMSSENLKILK